MNAPARATLVSGSLPPGRTVEQALARARGRKEYLWRQDIDEDDRIDELVAYCTGLCGGDERAGEILATNAIWGD
jgi:hypothetical protein